MYASYSIAARYSQRCFALDIALAKGIVLPALGLLLEVALLPLLSLLVV
jgi:hypothetical protein